MSKLNGGFFRFSASLVRVVTTKDREFDVDLVGDEAEPLFTTKVTSSKALSRQLTMARFRPRSQACMASGTERFLFPAPIRTVARCFLPSWPSDQARSRTRKVSSGRPKLP